MTAFAIQANLAFDNYDELIAAVNSWLDRSDLTDVAPQFIALAEDEMRIKLEPVFAETSTSLATDSTGFATLPSDCKRVSRIIIDNRVVPAWGAQSPDYEHLGSTARGFTLERGGVRVWPGGEYTATVLYQPLLERLSNANPTNNLLDLFPSLYFYGAMVFAHGYVEDDQRAASFRGLFDNMMEEVRQYYLRQRHSGPLTPRVACIP